MNSIDFRIDSVCNLQCEFCFGASSLYTLNLDKLENFFVMMKEKLGLENVVLTGGEPTLSPNFIDVINLLTRLDLKIALSSNVFFWSDIKLRNVVIKNVKSLGIPLESNIEIVHNKLRCTERNHYRSVIEMLSDIKKLNIDLKIKLGTVICKENFNSVEGILDVLPIVPDVWKLYQLSYSNKNELFYERQKITNELFIEKVRIIKKYAESFGVCVKYSLEYDRDGKYLFLEPNGDIATIYNNKERKIGHYLQNEKELMNSIYRYINFDKLNQNFISSF